MRRLAKEEGMGQAREDLLVLPDLDRSNEQQKFMSSGG
jgi:hypothetical protein